MQLVQRRGWKTDIWKSAKRSLREGQRRAKLHLLEEIFDLFKKIPERVLNLWKSSSLCSSWHWPAHLVENSPRGLASPRLYGEDNFCNSCGQQQEQDKFSLGLEMWWPKSEIVWILKKSRAVLLFRQTSRCWGRWDYENKYFGRYFLLFSFFYKNVRANWNQGGHLPP